MESMELVGYNTKWYRYKKQWTQEVFAEKTGFKMAYVSSIERGVANLTCRNIDIVANTLKIKQNLLFDESTAKLAMELPKRVDMFKN